MEYSKGITFAICMAASTVLAMVISGWVFGTVNLISVFIGMAGGFVVALARTRNIRS